MISKIYEKYSEERKRLQSIGACPEWMTTAGFQLLSDKNYLLPLETPKDMYLRIANRAKELISDKVDIALFNDGTNIVDWSELLFRDLWNGWLSPSSTVLSNLGTEKGHPVSCSQTHLEDSIDGFYKTRHEIAMLTKAGYGTSVNLSEVRPRGSSFAFDGVASGVTQPMEGLRKDMTEVTQGQTRKGSIGQYLDVTHGDFDEVVSELIAEDQGLNIGWNLTDKYEEMFKSNPERADHIWKRMMKAKMQTGKGYFFWVDKVNRRRPQMYVDRGLSVVASNLCVIGSTKVLTKEGYKPIKELADTFTECWNGTKWSTTQIAKTSDKAKVVKVLLSNMTELEVTPEHEWYVMDGYSKSIKKPTTALEIGDKLVKFDLEPVTHGSKELELAYENGFHSGDGTVYKDNGRARISLHDGKQTLVNRFSAYKDSTYTKDGRILNLHYRKEVLRDKFFMPNSSYSVDSRLRWLEGYLDADGTVTNNNGTESIQVASIELDFLQELMLLLQELGIHSTVSKVRDAGYTKLPANNGTGKLKEYWTKDTYRLLIAGSELNKLLDLGYEASRVQPTRRTYQRQARQFVKVVSIVNEGKEVETYCGNEPEEHKLMFNGVLTGQCCEIHLFSDKDHTYSCVLSTVNAFKYDEWKNTSLINRGMVFLDIVIDDMLIKAKEDISGAFERIIRFTENTRAVGLGIQGNTSYMQDKGMIFGDLQSRAFEYELFSKLNKESLQTSEYLANVLGEPPYMIGYGKRFSHRLTLPPTMSTSIIMGGYNQGCEVPYANIYTQDTAGGNVFRINPVFLELLKSRGKYTEEVMQRIVMDNGSVQEEDWLTDREKEVFRTAFEVNQYTILSMASERQKHVDQGQSINLYIDNSTTEQEISKLHLYANDDPEICGLYYVRSLNGLAKHKVSDECVVCEG